VTSIPALPTDDKDDPKKKSGLFGKKFPMNFPKTLGRKSGGDTPKQSTTSSNEEKAEDASDKSSERDDRTIEDNFFGVIQKIRQEYADQADANPDEPLSMGITPSLPIETPVLKPPLHTTVIIQEDNPGSGGLADQYRGEIGRLGRPEEADVLEHVAPMWLGELLLMVRQPFASMLAVYCFSLSQLWHFTIS
jgi:WD repeat-containing protein 48